MIIPIIILVISFVLDGLLSNFLPYMVGDLSLFTPMLTIVSLIIIYHFFTKKKNNYFIICFIVGLIYDFMYTNLLFYNAILFLVLGLVIMFLYRYIRLNWLSLFLFISAFFFIKFVFSYKYFLFYKFGNCWIWDYECNRYSAFFISSYDFLSFSL